MNKLFHKWHIYKQLIRFTTVMTILAVTSVSASTYIISQRQPSADTGPFNLEDYLKPRSLGADKRRASIQGLVQKCPEIPAPTIDGAIRYCHHGSW